MPILWSQTVRQSKPNIYIYSLFFFLHHIYFPRTTLSPSLPVVTQSRSHIAGPPPSPHYGTCLCFYREKKSAFSSLIDWRRIVWVLLNKRFKRISNSYKFRSQTPSVLLPCREYGAKRGKVKIILNGMAVPFNNPKWSESCRSCLFLSNSFFFFLVRLATRADGGCSRRVALFHFSF